MQDYVLLKDQASALLIVFLVQWSSCHIKLKQDQNHLYLIFICKCIAGFYWRSMQDKLGNGYVSTKGSLWENINYENSRITFWTLAFGNSW